MTINATAAILLAFYVAVADERGIPRSQLGGTVQNDILKEYIARGTYIYPDRAVDAPGHRHLRVLRARAAALEHHQHQRLPHARGGRDRRTGAGLHARRRASRTSMRRARAVSMSTHFAGRLSFFFASWSELFEEVAKFRAARRMWARIMRDRFGAREARSMMCRFHTQTAGSSLTAHPSTTTWSGRRSRHWRRSWAAPRACTPTPATRRSPCRPRNRPRLALRTQQILAYESGVTETPDPLAGSYFVESLTDRLEAAARSTWTEIDAMGGAIAAIEAGYQQRNIQDAAYRAQRRDRVGRVDRGRRQPLPGR